MTNLIVSMIRFSTALSLYSVEELERSMNVNVMEGGDTELGKTIDRFGKTLNSLTGVLVNDMDRNRKETLDSVTKVSHEMVNRTMGGMDVMNPRDALKASTDLLQETSEIIAKWVSKAPSAV